MRKSPGVNGAQQRANLRVCASCEWIFHLEDASEHGGCPKCEFAHYGARFVFGSKAYRYAETQEPWRRVMLSHYGAKLDAEISQTMAKSKRRKAALPAAVGLTALLRVSSRKRG